MKNYLIIGGSSGIGLSLTNLLAIEGHNVFASFNSKPAYCDRSNVTFFHLDVLSEDIQFDSIPDELQGVAYCPGSINLMPFKRLKPKKFVDDYNLQVIGAIKVLQKVSGALAAGNGAVVLFSSVAVQQGFNFHTQVSASKGAIEGLTRALAAEWAPKIRVNAIAPSLTDTPLASKLLSTDEKRASNAERHPLKKIGTPDEVAQTAAFLLSDRANWMTGQIIHLDGGMSSIR